MRHLTWILILLGLLVALPAQRVLAQNVLTSSVVPEPIRLELFGRGDSDLSQTARDYVERLGRENPGLEVVFHDVLADREQLARLWTLAKKSGRDKPVVPAFYCCGQMHFGFTDEGQNGADVEKLFTVEVYTRNTCSRCQSGKAFIKSTLQPRWPGLRFKIYEISYDSAAQRRYAELCASAGKLQGLPMLYFAGQVIVGYQGDHITGAQWQRLIEKATGHVNSE